MKQFWKGKNILVTGAGGFVGSHFVEELSSIGANVIGTLSIDSSRPYDSSDVDQDFLKFIKIDLLDFDKLLKKISDKKIDTIIHCAALDGNADFKAKNSARIMDENSRMVSNILNVAKKVKIVNVVLMSSAEIYAAQANSPIIEEEDYRKYFAGESNGYVLAKIFSEVLGTLYAKQFDMKVFFPRPTNIYGPRDKFDSQSNRVIPSMIYKILNGKDIEIWGDGSQVRGFVYVKDLVYSVLSMVECDEHRVMNIATKESISIFDLAKLISKIIGKEANILLLPDKPMGIKRRVLNSNKLRSIVSSELMSLEKGLKETIEWCKKL